MNERTNDVLRFIVRFQRAYPGLSPTYRQIMDAVDIPSTSLVAHAIRRLVREGELVETNLGMQHGLIVKDAVLLTREDAERMGLDWLKLSSHRELSRQRMGRVMA